MTAGERFFDASMLLFRVCFSLTTNWLADVKVWVEPATFAVIYPADKWVNTQRQKKAKLPFTVELRISIWILHQIYSAFHLMKGRLRREKQHHKWYPPKLIGLESDGQEKHQRATDTYRRSATVEDPYSLATASPSLPPRKRILSVRSAYFTDFL